MPRIGSFLFEVPAALRPGNEVKIAGHQKIAFDTEILRQTLVLTGNWKESFLSRPTWCLTGVVMNLARMMSWQLSQQPGAASSCNDELATTYALL